MDINITIDDGLPMTIPHSRTGVKAVIYQITWPIDSEYRFGKKGFPGILLISKKIILQHCFHEDELANFETLSPNISQKQCGFSVNGKDTTSRVGTGQAAILYETTMHRRKKTLKKCGLLLCCCSTISFRICMPKMQTTVSPGLRDSKHHKITFFSKNNELSNSNWRSQNCNVTIGLLDTENPSIDTGSAYQCRKITKLQTYNGWLVAILCAILDAWILSDDVKMSPMDCSTPKH